MCELFVSIFKLAKFVNIFTNLFSNNANYRAVVPKTHSLEIKIMIPIRSLAQFF